MAYQNLEPVSKQLTIVIGLTVVGFMAFGFALSFYRNLLFEQTLGEIGMQNNVLRERIAEGHRSLEYFQSSQYKDKYSKERKDKANFYSILDEYSNLIKGNGYYNCKRPNTKLVIEIFRNKET